MKEFNEYIETNFKFKIVSSGTEYQINYCPFCCKEKDDARIYISIKDGLGFCHHCGTGFSPVKFVMENEKVDKKTAFKILKLKEGSYHKIPSKYIDKDVKIEFPETVEITEGHIALEYLKKRNVDLQMVEFFQLRYDFQRKRILIPIFDIDGKMGSWQGRDITGKSKYKYLFPKGFKGAEYLYNINNIVSGTYLVISEGVFDVFGWYTSGITNVVATFGKKISDKQIEYIYQKKPKKIFIAWDSDAILEKYKLAERLIPFFEDIYIVDLDGKDADELSSMQLKKYLLNAKKYSWDDKVKSLI